MKYEGLSDSHTLYIRAHMAEIHCNIMDGASIFCILCHVDFNMLKARTPSLSW